MYTDKDFDTIISKAAEKLNEIYFLTGDNLDAYKPIETGFILGLSLAIGEEPHMVQEAIEDVE